ncbi:MAG: VRR-NUC domain-containing protein [Geobacteraceae bacterium]|nr:VRR-NUC domain-containing protein [Geobacteraceae bacterium]
MIASKSEGRIHQDCYVWFHNTFPEFRGLLCYNLGNSKNMIDGALNKSKGVQPGRSDFTLYWMGSAVMIEMKDDDGRQSKDQVNWQRLIERHGFRYIICRSLESFKEVVEEIIKQEDVCLFSSH